MFLTANNVQATAEIAALNSDVLISSIAAVAAIIAAIAALVGVIIGAAMGASSARKTKVTEVYFEKKYEAYCDLIAAIDELRINGDNLNLSVPFLVLSRAAILSSPQTYEIIKKYEAKFLDLYVAYDIMNNREGKSDYSEYMDDFRKALQNTEDFRHVLIEAFRSELVALGEKGRVHRK